MATAPPIPPPDLPPSLGTTRSASGVRLGDRIFRGSSMGAGIFVLVVMGAIGTFLLIRAIPSLTSNKANVLTTQDFDPDNDRWGIAALAYGTLASSIIALVLAVPVAIGIALFISHYAPRRIAVMLAYIVDLLAAVPSVIFGLWGLRFLSDHILPVEKWINDYFGWIPIFGGNVNSPASLFTAGVVLAIMILPIIAAVCREVFLQVPRAHEEAALALGATRWEMIRTAVLPFGRPGIISATMLGLGRALGETIAIALILSPSYTINASVLESGGSTFAANIALRFGEIAETGRSALIASGLVLFLITLVVNIAARAVIARRKEFSGASA